MQYICKIDKTARCKNHQCRNLYDLGNPIHDKQTISTFKYASVYLISKITGKTRLLQTYGRLVRNSN